MTVLNQGRFIPTRMGNTGTPGAAVGVVAVHPHTHGEHLRYKCYDYPQHGSSPHAWGTLLFLYKFL